MAQLFIPLTGAYRSVTGSGVSTRGESLERPLWRGAEIGECDTFPDVLGAVSESEFYDWNIGVRHPLYKENGPEWCRFFDPEPHIRAAALETAVKSAQAAHHLGVKYIIFRFPWPALQMPGADYAGLGWSLNAEPVPVSAWPAEDLVLEWSLRAFDRLAELQEQERIKVGLEIDGPNPHFFDGELYSRLFAEYPNLSLCIDTGRLGLLARTHGQDPVALAQRWLPWTRYLHLHTSAWDHQGRCRSQIPTDGSHTAALWPQVTPAADIARLVVAAQPGCTIVLDHDPRLVTPEELEAAHRFAASLVEGTLPAGTVAIRDRHLKDE